MDIDVSIHNGSQVSKSVDLSTFSFATTGTVGHIQCVQHRPVVVLSFLSTKPNKQQCSGWGISVCNPQLTAHDFSQVNAITFVHSVFMVSRQHCQDLVFDRFKDLHALLQLFHGLKVCAVSITNAGCNSGVHQITVQDAVCIWCLFDVFNLFQN